LSEEKYKYIFDTKEILIRLYQTSDSVHEITSLLHKAYRQLADMGFRFVATHQNEAETLRRINKGICYLALSNDNIISTITLYYNDPDTHDALWYKKKGVAHFGQFAVLPEYQKNGIGNFMMNIVEERAKSEGAVEIALDTAEGAVHLIKYYKQRGYRFIDYVKWEVTNYRSMILSKRLQ
jgi:GNAT superfamily N-acetyltransferase